MLLRFSRFLIRDIIYLNFMNKYVTILIAVFTLSLAAYGGYYLITDKPVVENQLPEENITEDVDDQVSDTPIPSISSPVSPAISNADELIARVKEKGTLPIIITFYTDPPYKALGDFSSEEGQLILTGVRQAEQQIIEDLEPFQAVNYARWEGIPSIAFRVSVEAMEYLVSNPLVKSIKEDTAVSPTSSD